MHKQNNSFEIFKHMGRLCVIDKCTQLPDTFPNGYHNGYIEVEKPEVYIDFASKDLSSHDIDDYIKTPLELTFEGYLHWIDDKRVIGKYFVGFDTAHCYNEGHNETTTKEAVKKSIECLCKLFGDYQKFKVKFVSNEFNCKGCGAKLELKDWQKKDIKCEYCGGFNFIHEPEW